MTAGPSVELTLSWCQLLAEKIFLKSERKEKAKYLMEKNQMMKTKSALDLVRDQGPHQKLLIGEPKP